MPGADRCFVKTLTVNKQRCQECLHGDSNNLIRTILGEPGHIQEKKNIPLFFSTK